MQSDIMGERVGPCFHCGIDHTPLWRVGPPEKPVLCNACGSRWRNTGTLDDYIPRHATNNTQGGQSSGLPAMGQSTMPINLDDLPLPELETGIFGYGQSASLDDETFANLSLESPFASPENFAAMLNTDETIEPPIWGSSSIPRRKRSVLPQRIQSPLERFHSQLRNVVEEPVFANQTTTEDYDDVLIYAKNKYIPDNEIGLGCVMLEPTSPIADSKAKPFYKPQQPDPYGLACTFELNPPSTYLLDSPSPTEDSKGKFVDIPEDDELGFGCMMLNSPTPAADSKGKSVDISEHEIGLGGMLLKSPTPSPDSKAKAPATEDDASGLVDVPIGLSSQGDTIMLNHVGLENFHFPNMNEREEMHEKKLSSSHHMTTRSRTSNNGGRKFFEDIYSYSPPRKVKDERVGKRPRGRPRKRTSQGPPGSSSETSRDFENTRILFENSSLGEALPTPSPGSGKSGELYTKETRVEMLTNDVDNKLILDESGFVFTATSEKGLGALEDDKDSQAPGN